MSTPLDPKTIEAHLARERGNRTALEQMVTAKQTQLQQVAQELERLKGGLEYNGLVIAGLEKDLAILHAAAQAAEQAAQASLAANQGGGVPVPTS